MRIAVTGCSGYLGSLLTPLLAADSRVASIVGLDRRPPPVMHAKLGFVPLDVREPTLAGSLDGVSAVVHLAFVVQEIHDKRLTYDINVRGTENVLAACAARGVRKLVVASSIAAYGCLPDRGVLREDSPREGNVGSYYSHTKRVLEERLDAFEAAHPGVIVTRLRPSIFCGRSVSNFLRESLHEPFVVHVAGNSAGLPIVYEGDVVSAFATAVLEDHPGAFNLHGGMLSVETMSRILGKRAVGVPYWLARVAADVSFKLGLSHFSGDWVELGRYPVEVSCEKARTQLGWAPTKTAEEAFVELVDSLKASSQA